MRNEKSKLFEVFYRFGTHKYFQLFITISIIVNSLILALDSSNNSDEMQKFLEMSNYIFTGIFVLEMIIKLLGSGIKLYFKDRFNIFDFLLIALSLVDIGLYYSKFSSKMAPLRAFRIFRLFKISKTWI